MTEISTTKAVVVVQLKMAGVCEVLLPKVRDDWVLVRIKAVAINPTDWKHVAYGAADVGCRVGCDYSGIVEQVGKNVTNFSKGDRITGWIHGGYVDAICLFADHQLCRCVLTFSIS